MKPDLTDWLGKSITVQIDRPKNSVHPDHPSLFYTVNYGFVPDTLAGDGEPIDAYVLGIHEPVETFSGVVVAVIVRKNDLEDKLVVAPREVEFSDAEIEAAVAFQEKYFKTTLCRKCN
jgi:inorganic pyrophosphatase